MSWPTETPGGVPFVPRSNCYRCFKPAVACICDAVARVANRTAITILQHPGERFHPVGTERIARLGLTRVQVERLAQWEDASEVRAQIPDHAALLYPSPEARDLSELAPEERPSHLVVLDGTWFQAKKVYDAHPWLQAMRPLKLTPSQPSSYRVRREPKVTYIATIEAIVLALRILEPQTPGLDGLLQSFAVMVDRQARYQFRQPGEGIPAPRLRVSA